MLSYETDSIWPSRTLLARLGIKSVRLTNLKVNSFGLWISSIHTPVARSEQQTKRFVPLNDEVFVESLKGPAGLLQPS